jgi:K(+)-stimulated pyrophosphate-energized sodium pump
MIEEVRRQFREDPGIMLGTSKPDYARCVDISVKSALREMIIPGSLAVASRSWSASSSAGRRRPAC